MEELPIISLNTLVLYMVDMSEFDDAPPPMPKASKVVSGLIWRTSSSVLPEKICGVTL